MAFNNLDLVNCEYIYPIAPQEEFYVEEKNPNGLGKCIFVSNNNVLFLKAKDRSPVVWSLKNRSCAEAAFIVKGDDSKIELHIIEMKSKLTLSEFNKVIMQWQGMFLSSLAALGVLKESFPERVIVYIAYSNDAVEPKDQAQPVLLKVAVGGAVSPGLKEWRAKCVSLHHGIDAQIIIGQRVKGDVDFGIV